MDTVNSQLGWGEAQWSKVSQAVTEEFNKASVVGAILPCYGPLADSTELVRKQQLLVSAGKNSISVEDEDPYKLWTLRVFVRLKHEQVNDDQLASALLAFRGAANLLARAEDRIVFQKDDKRSGWNPFADLTEKKGTGSEGLIHAVKTRSMTKAPGTTSHDLVREITAAVGELENDGHPGPYACVLGNDAFAEAHSPTASMVMPADRITPILKGPLLRCGQLPENRGVVVSSAGEPIDLVVATAPKVQFLQINEEAKYVFRVYERFVLRVKDPRAVVALAIK